VRRLGRRWIAAAAIVAVLGGGGALILGASGSGFANYVLAGLFGQDPNTADLTGGEGNLGMVVVTVNLDGKGRPISPYVYGVAGADPTTLAQLGATLNRWGGNPSTRYNWVNGHAWNAARDWEFRNVNYGDSNASQADQFVREASAQGVAPLLTVPTMGWVARDDNTATRSTGVPSEGGPALAGDPQAIAGYDPRTNQRRTSLQSMARSPGPMRDAPPPSSSIVYQDEWVHHLVTTFGARSIPFLTMDNEPDLWSSTHTDVHPVRMGYDDMLRNFEDYATAVKAVAPGALILGPDVSGWTGYWYSDLDRGTDNFGTHADRRAHSDKPFLAWWLGEVARQDRARGARSLDLLDVHYYPQATMVTSPAHDAKTQLLRIRSVRSLYDPAFVDPSWIAEPVRLIPRLKDWIAQNYPGTGLAITEYKWGGEDDASGAVALAESLGIFGREGVDVAAYWTFPKPDTPAGAAFRMYRNFDGKGGHFGDRSLTASSSARAVQAFASRDSTSGDVEVMLINESLSQTANVHLDAKLSATARASIYQVLGGSFAIDARRGAWGQPLSLPPLSVTLVRVPAAGQA